MVEREDTLRVGPGGRDVGDERGIDDVAEMPRNLRPMRYDLAVGVGRRVWGACQTNLSAYAMTVSPDLVARVRSKLTAIYNEPGFTPVLLGGSGTGKSGPSPMI